MIITNLANLFRNIKAGSCYQLSVPVSVSLNVARQRLRTHFPTANNTKAAIEERLKPVSTMRSVSNRVICSERK
jgi:hypothetical protein